MCNGRVDRFLRTLQVEVCLLCFRLVSRRCHKISTIHPLAPAPHRTVRALFTHMVIHKVSAMRCSFVATCSPPLRAEDVSSHRSTMCGILSSSGITRLHQYYDAIRLPALDLPFSLFGRPAYSHLWKQVQGLPGYRIITMSDMPWSPTPGKWARLAKSARPMLTSTSTTVSSFPTRHFRGSIPSTNRLTACLLAVLRLKKNVTTLPPKTRYPVAGLPSGTGFPPAG